MVMNQPITIQRRGLMLVLSSPSGAGKTTISRELLKTDEDLKLSISVTTRKRRPGEVSGRDYHFYSVDEFNQMVENEQLLEYAKVFDHYYGTPRAPVEDTLNAGKDVLFDIDWQGTQQLSQMARGDLVSIFILPPSWDELQRRLTARAQDSEETVEKRMAKAADEMSHWAEYDYVIINHDFDKSVKKVQKILASERLKRSRQIGLAEFVKGLRQKI
jgi:guanylate kinase